MSAPRDDGSESIRMPAPTAWPMLLAAGICLGFAGLVTNAIVTVTGAGLAVIAARGWIREVLPVQHLEEVELRPAALRARDVLPSTARVDHLEVGRDGHRMRLPIEIHPWTAGLGGGLIGALVMALVAAAIGVATHGSPWYPINLLAATVMPSLSGAGTATLEAFDPTAFGLASVIHLLASLLVGALYGLILPLVPRHHVLVGGLVAPLFWTGLLWAVLGVLNPALNGRIEWPWFVLSQVAFGLAVGWFVSRREKIATLQDVPLAARAGIEAAGLGPGRDEA
ncbi:hypothetical protein KGQ64_10975 [bacterium]|nr:hypothetical protein [bacterium]